MEITVLCKVVDNFGDIGVAFRLIKSLVELGKKNEEDKARINLIVDDLVAFNRINSQIDVNKSFQEMDGYNVYAWNDYDYCYRTFSGENTKRLEIILELFQCGRPDWMEKILFEDELERVVNIIMIDYLTAEDYAESFHCLESLTRRKKVQKVNFMPGFTSKTGGLIIGDAGEVKQGKNKEQVVFFCYDREGSGWNPVINALNSSPKPCELKIAQGKGKDCVVHSCENISEEKRKLTYQVLPFMNQNEWDEMLKSSGFLFIRGEESMSRACLFGIPFVWHAYPQSDEYQMVKVNALLNRMERHFKNEDFELVKNVWLDFNMPAEEVDSAKFEADVRKMYENKEKIAYGFEDFAKDLRKNGDLGVNLMTFIKKKIIIK